LALLVLVVALVATWQLFAPHGDATRVSRSAASLVGQQAGDVSRIAASVSEPEVSLLANDQPTPPATTGDVTKNARGASSSRNVPASRGLCNPPYTVDPQGRKKFRHECFTEPTAR